MSGYVSYSADYKGKTLSTVGFILDTTTRYIKIPNDNPTIYYFSKLLGVNISSSPVQVSC